MNKMKKRAAVLLALITILVFNVQSVFAATDVTYWKGSLAKGGLTGDRIYSNSPFNMTGSSVTIKGYHYLPGFTTDASANYQIVAKGLFSDDVKGEKFISGYYPESGTWYNSSISLYDYSSRPTGVYIKVISTSPVHGVSVGGNAFQ